VPWVEIFVVLGVSHLVGDFVLQTEFQARNKAGGLGSDPVARRALLAHVLTYTLAFVPALVWIADGLSAGEAAATAALVSLPHMVQDDGRLLDAYVLGVKKTDPSVHPIVAIMVDQSVHMVVLLLIAILIGS
jgi:hypothetical protein